ncbi:hypothetical protein H2248_008143 [Termitomyces sp. 'cryptogamus']|nr:hypothetical protein H2248_008143 [Termitomyces sp. 'cryptogamus']
MAPRLQLKRALRSAARFPSRIARHSPSELPLVLLRVQVLSCTALAARDRNGFSDPFVVASLLGERHQTPVAKRTVSPTYVPREATWDFSIYLSAAPGLGAVEIVVWDKDTLGKDYLGEAAIPLGEWFAEGRGFGWDDLSNKPFTVNLESTRVGAVVSGAVSVKLGFVKPTQSLAEIEFDEIYAELLKRSRLSLVSAPPTEGVGTISSSSVLEDDGGLSSDEAESDDESDDDYIDALEEIPMQTTPVRVPANTPPQLTVQPSSPPSPTSIPTPLTYAYPPTPTSTPVMTKPPSPSFARKFSIPIRRLSGLTSSPSANSSPSSSPSPVDPTLTEDGVPTQELTSTKKGRFFGSRKNLAVGGTPPTPGAEVIDPFGGDGEGKTRKRMGRKRVGKSGKGKAYSYDAGDNDIIGIVMLEVLKAEDLPRLKNMTRTSFDMDPFVVISFGKKVFRTRVVRHSLNPTWDEKLLFHVRRYETKWNVQLRVHDWDKMSSNDFVGEAGFEVQDLIDKAPQKNPQTDLYDSESGEHDMVEFKLPLDGEPGNEREGRHHPVIYVRAKYQPYDLLRHRFWRKYLAQYDTDDTNAISHVELTSLLDSLGSTLTHDTVDAFWYERGKKPHVDELSVEEAIKSLEGVLGRPEGERRRVGEGGLGVGVEGGMSSGSSQTPVVPVSSKSAAVDVGVGAGVGVGVDVGAEGDGALGLDFSKMDFGGEVERVGTPGSYSSSAYSSDDAGEGGVPVVLSPSSSSGSGNGGAQEQGLGLMPPKAQVGVVAGAVSASGFAQQTKKRSRFRRRKVPAPTAPTPSSSDPASVSSEEDVVERVINVKSCPLCHRPRLSDKAEVDIVTHMAVCASTDWARIGRIVVGEYVTASQAQRKWYTKIINKVGGGDYRLGANSANIIVQNRMTGQLDEEKMQVYVRLGIRLLYKGATSRMEGGRARKLLKSLSFKQGVKYDSFQSAAEIPAFIEFHGLNVEEILDPLDSFKTFNEFFYRKLKPSARPIESPDDPYRLVSAADCRLMTFATIDDATRLWIKGREFSVPKLLGDAYRDEAERYKDGALVIFRLAPQDYHRFHSPVEGTIGPMSVISGEYYTVNPQAIRSSLDVYGENVRKIVPIDSPQFGRVMAVCIGAMMVGSIKTTVQEGEHVRRGQEFGYFAFGGSTIVMLFERDRVVWDEDLLINGRASLETLVRFGTGIGMGRRPATAAV